MSGSSGLREITVEAAKASFQRRERARMRIGDREYVLVLGDVHRHTYIRGHSAVHGSTEDTYRYAIDPAQLDYVDPSDHNAVNRGGWPDGLPDYHWWCNQKLVGVYTHPQRFWGIYPYEHSMSRPGGHRNALYLK